VDVQVKQTRHHRIMTEVALHPGDPAVSGRVGCLESELSDDRSILGDRLTIDQQIYITVTASPTMGAPLPLPLAIPDTAELQRARQTLQERFRGRG
jgi:hypothetical protein